MQRNRWQHAGDDFLWIAERKCLLSTYYPPRGPMFNLCPQWILLIPLRLTIFAILGCWKMLTCSFTQSWFGGKHLSLFLSLSLWPVSPSASLKEATHHGAWRMCAAGRLCSRKATLITPNTTTTQFSSLAKASAPRGCRVRPRRTHSCPVLIWYSYGRFSIIIHSSSICDCLIRTHSWVCPWH